MPLRPASELLDAALRGSYAVGAFNVVGLEGIEAVLGGAAEARAPVIVQVSENAARYASLAGLLAAAHALAAEAPVPAAVHYDHGTGAESCGAALALGCRSVMLDGSELPYDENVRLTRSVAEAAHAAGGVCEGELGVVGGKPGQREDAGLTDPDEAARFVAATGVDSLGCALGTRHGMVTRDGSVDLEQARRIHAAAGVPLVLHGSSGVPDETLAEVGAAGVAKVNLATVLTVSFTAALRAALAADERVTDPRRYLAPARDAMRTRVRELIGVLGAAGRA